MIRYDLNCDKGHRFDAWFRSSADYDGLRAAGQVECAICRSTTVEKALMAPAVPAGTVAAAPEAGPRALSQPRNPAEAALEQLRHHVETNSDYVGMSFSAEARAMHDGDIPERPIHGEARPEDARKLIEDGIPVAPLPFRPRSRTN
ncbi:DUF1178 family protein [Paracoccus pacificus]|uniref:DUF1178 family protein n=1 Tax=Paracoccus pacificus TaxID=1463598 RepID=A0ABW4RAZ4_9RHOB